MNLEKHIAGLNQPRPTGPVPRPILMRIRSRGISVALESIAHASALYCILRDESGEGASDWPDATLFQRGTFGRTDPLGRISYNGRVWSLADRCIHEPRGRAVQAEDGSWTFREDA